MARWLTRGTWTDIDTEKKITSVDMISVLVVAGDYVEKQWDSITINCGVL